MHAGGLGSVWLGSRAAPTCCVGSVDDRCDDGHDFGAAAGFFGAGGVPCDDDVDYWSWSICMTATTFELLQPQVWLARKFHAFSI